MTQIDPSTRTLKEWFALGVAQMGSKQWSEAEGTYRHIVARWPNVVQAQHNLAVTLLNQQKFEEAVEAYRRTIALKPDSGGASDACLRMADALRRLNRPDEAIEAYRQALGLQPNLLEAWHNMGGELRKTGHPKEAIEAFQKVLALRPDLPEPWNNIGNALRQMGRRTEAIEGFQKAIALRPEYPEAWSNLAYMLQEVGRPAEAIEAYRRAVKYRPEYPEAWNNLGALLVNNRQPAEAIEALRQAISFRPDYAAAWNNLGGAFKDAAQLDEALAAFDRAVSLRPDEAPQLGNRLYALCFHPAYDARAIYQESQRWNARFVRPRLSQIAPHANDAASERRLRVGYVSPDFCRHCAAIFIMPLLAQHDHGTFEIFCYSNVGAPDPATARLRAHADAWRDIARLSDHEVVQLIRQDKIDILVDLALHMNSNRLGVFAHKPAPVQVTWLGYVGTTGLETIDYRLTDPRLDPLDLPSGVSVPETSEQSSQSTINNPQFSIPKPGIQEPHYSERSVHLPETFWCYDPWGIEDSSDVDLPVPGPLPALAAGHVTFGCLNNLCKVTDLTLKLWERAMAAVPGSRLIMVAPPGPHRDRLAPALGVAPERLTFVPYQDRKVYLETYNQIDICLDPLPYNGGTTTLDAAWMGVPVVTRVGQTAVGRAGWSILHNLGLTKLVARSDDEFVKIVADLSGDLEELGQLRATLRTRMERSPLMDAPRFARNVEAAYRAMWRAWADTCTSGTRLDK